MATAKIEQTLVTLRRWDNIRITGNGAQLIRHVPHVAPEAWFHILYKGLSADEINEYETRYRITYYALEGDEETEYVSAFPVRFPDAYREFLTVANGANLFFDSLSISGYRKNYERKGDAIYQPYDLLLSNQTRPGSCPDSWLFFGRYRWDGTRIHFDTSLGIKNSQVFATRRESTKITNTWPSFDDWFLTEVERLADMFDENGRKKNPQEPTIPPDHLP